MRMLLTRWNAIECGHSPSLGTGVDSAHLTDWMVSFPLFLKGHLSQNYTWEENLWDYCQHLVFPIPSNIRLWGLHLHPHLISALPVEGSTSLRRTMSLAFASRIWVFWMETVSDSTALFSRICGDGNRETLDIWVPEELRWSELATDNVNQKQTS